jgi:prophage maintenance system killer protein
VLLLEFNGCRFVASEENAAETVLKLAAGESDEGEYATFLRGNTVRRKK